MTRKDYVLIAKEIKMLIAQEKSVADVGYNNGVRETVNVLCRALKADNPKFNEAKFKKACGIGG